MSGASLGTSCVRVRVADASRGCPRCAQLENARAALDLYRSHAADWEGAVSSGHWPAYLPPSTFSRCYL